MSPCLLKLVQKHDTSLIFIYLLKLLVDKQYRTTNRIDMRIKIVTEIEPQFNAMQNNAIVYPTYEPSSELLLIGTRT